MPPHPPTGNRTLATLRGQLGGQLGGQLAGRLRAARARRAGWRGPVLVRTVDAAVAATLAWVLVQPFGGAADAYPYLAPLGAVITVTESVASSLREGLATVGNLVLGALLGTWVLLLEPPVAVGLAGVIAVGAALQATGLGAGGATWLSYGAVLVLMVGTEDPLAFGLAYAGLISLGALAALVTVSVLPPLLVAPGSLVITQAGEAVAGQLDDLADGLSWQDPPSQEDWAARQHALTPQWRHLADTAQLAARARRGNWRARWWSRREAEQDRVVSLLEATFPLVQHLTLLLSCDENADRAEPALGPRLRPRTVEVLRAWATVLRQVTRSPDDQRSHDQRSDEQAQDEEGAHRELGAALDRLTEELRAVRQHSRADAFAAGAVVSTVRRGYDLTGATS